MERRTWIFLPLFFAFIFIRGEGTLCPTSICPQGGCEIYPGLLTQVYNSTNFEGSPILNTTGLVNFDWVVSGPANLSDNFSIHFSGYLIPPATATYQFQVTTDDGARIWINGTKILDQWKLQSNIFWTSPIVLLGGKPYPLLIDYFESTSTAKIILKWNSTSLALQVVSDLYRITCNCPVGFNGADCENQYSCLPETREHASWNVTLASTIATGTCLGGYYSPNATRFCNASNSWGDISSPCAAVYCAAGSSTGVSWPQTLSETSTNFLCTTGYYSPNTTIRCIQNGATAFWDSATPIACSPVLCPFDASDPSVSWPSVLAGSAANGSCQAGYFSEDPSRVCSQNGPNATWSTISNPCLPIYCLAGEEQNASFPLTQATHLANATCRSGFHSADPSASCVQNGAAAFWSLSAPCLPVYCPKDESSQSISWGQTLAGNTVSGVCNVGYYSSLTPQRACIQDGGSASWGSILNPCEAVLCPSAQEFNAIFPEALGGTTIEIDCIEGYFSTNSSATCIQNGSSASWDLASPCQPVSCPEDASSPGVIWPQVLGGTTFNATCLSGYHSAHPQRTCNQNGATASWGTVSAPCQAVYCPSTTAENAIFNQTLGGQRVEASCLPNFYSANTSVSCLQNGATATWGTLAEPCLAVYCLDDESASTNWPAQTLPGNVATGSCKPGYFSSGVPSRGCSQLGPLGVWGSISNPCQAVYCNAQESQNATFVKTLAGLTVNASCHSGYYSANPSVSCIQNGATASWGTLAIPCSPGYCDADASDPSVSWPATLGGRLANGTCKLGYYSSNPQRQCIPSELVGVWGSITNPCQAVYCSATSLNHANFPSSLGGLKKNVSCDANYFSSDPSATCIQTGANATWEAPQSPCELIFCPQDDSDASVLWPSVQAGAIASGSCKLGYFSTLPQRSCLQGDGPIGLWDAISQPCLAVKCAAKNEDHMEVGETLGGMSVQATCHPGYSSTNATMSCRQEGPTASWDSIASPCLPIPCPEDSSDPSVLWPQAIPGEQAPGQCNPGFYSPNPQRLCLLGIEVGIWGNVSDPCQQVYCAAVTEGNASWPITATLSIASGTCQEGFFSQNPQRTCQFQNSSGLWASEIINPCQRVYCALEILPNVTLPETQVGLTVNVSCHQGYYSASSPSATCLQNGPTGNWIFPPSSSCEPVSCPEDDSSSSVFWPQVLGGSSAVGVCRAGYHALDPRRECIQAGPLASWGSISDPCLPVYCPATKQNNASLAQTLSGTSTEGICDEGFYSADPSVSCIQQGASGTWTSLTIPCEAVYCPADEEGDASVSWPSVLAGTTAIGTCKLGYALPPSPSPSPSSSPSLYSIPHRLCWMSPAGVAIWGSPSNPCQRLSCPANRTSNVEWPKTWAGEIGVGRCISGMNQTSSSPLTRECLLDGEIAIWLDSEASCNYLCPSGCVNGRCSSYDVCLCQIGSSGKNCSTVGTNFDEEFSKIDSVTDVNERLGLQEMFLSKLNDPSLTPEQRTKASEKFAKLLSSTLDILSSNQDPSSIDHEILTQVGGQMETLMKGTKNITAELAREVLDAASSLVALGSAVSESVCNDTLCDLHSETCSSCPADCGQCSLVIDFNSTTGLPLSQAGLGFIKDIQVEDSQNFSTIVLKSLQLSEMINPAKISNQTLRFSGINFLVNFLNNSALISKRSGPTLYDGKIVVTVDISGVTHPPNSTFVLNYYDPTSSTWMDATQTCTPPHPLTITPSTLTAIVCAVGQYALHFTTSGSSAELYPLETSIANSLSSILSGFAPGNNTNGNNGTPESSAQLMNLVDELADLLSASTFLDGPPAFISTPTLYIQVQKVSKDRLSSVTFTPALQGSSDSGAQPSISLPSSISLFIPASVEILDASMSIFSINPFSWAPSSETLRGSILEFSLKDASTSTKLNISIPSNEDGINIKLPFTPPADPVQTSQNETTITNVTQIAVCKFWDGTLVMSNCQGSYCVGGWSTVGVKTIQGSNGTVTCLSQHLTAFSVHLDFTINSVPVPDLEAVVLIFVFEAVVILTFLALLGAAWYVDRRAVKIHSVKQTYGGRLSARFKEQYSQAVKERHLFVSLMSATSHRKRFTRVRRTTALLSTLLLTMGINSLFEQARSVDNTANAIEIHTGGKIHYFSVAGFYTSLLVFPASLLMLFSFTYGSGHEQTIIRVNKKKRSSSSAGSLSSEASSRSSSAPNSMEKGLNEVGREKEIAKNVSSLESLSSLQESKIDLSEDLKAVNDFEMELKKEADQLKRKQDHHHHHPSHPEQKEKEDEEKEVVTMVALKSGEEEEEREGEREGEREHPSSSRPAPSFAKLASKGSIFRSLGNFAGFNNFRKSHSIFTRRTLVDNDEMLVQIIPAYREEDAETEFGDPQTKTELFWAVITARKLWLIFAYFQALCFSSLGIILPFFYAGAMNYHLQVYWMIGVLISAAMTSIVYQPLQAIFLSFYKAYSTAKHRAR